MTLRMCHIQPTIIISRIHFLQTNTIQFYFQFVLLLEQCLIYTSKMIIMLKDNLITLVLMHTQPPMMSRVCQWREMVMMME